MNIVGIQGRNFGIGLIVADGTSVLRGASWIIHVSIAYLGRPPKFCGYIAPSSALAISEITTAPTALTTSVCITASVSTTTSGWA